ncbi:P-loop containing nucleoside triphosphate hydrolase protein [Auricularia subglabra TFB-10046 SS5]|nr:P-loop containing nucleoside triphosphate hydrolase protein [Auricularia subglabra TFB-10046 SS5]
MNGTNGRATVKQERIKREKLASQRRKATTPPRNSDGEEDANNEPNGRQSQSLGPHDDEDDDEGPRRRRKRIRVSDTGDAVEAGQGDDENGEADDDEPAPPRPVTLPRAEDGYVPGSIVRVLLKNFVTYDWVEFSPGPYLNMIIGPNGTGKSSIACALCIGLGWPPSLLGRAGELKAFVKNGCDEGFIEIELRGPLGKPNLVIRRLLNANDNKSIWRLNGQETTAKEVQSRVQALNVQVDNLCTFLPQDKVSSFAHMTPQQLLRETQKAAGHPNLTKWHQMLIDSGKTLGQLDESLKTDYASIEDKQNRNARLEREVAKFKERREIEKQVAILKIMHPFAVTWQLQLQERELKADLAQKRTLMERMNAKNKPLNDLKAKLETIVADQRNGRKRMQDAMQAKMKEMQKKSNEGEQLEKAAADTANALQGIKAAEKKRKQRIEGWRKQIEELEKKVANPPEVEDEADIRAELTTINEKLAEVQTEDSNVKDDLRKSVDEQARFIGQRERCAAELQRLLDVEQQRLANLRRWDPDCALAVEWMRKNGDKFKMEVFEPALLSARPKDMRYVDQLESCLGGNQFKIFVAQCQEDYNTLNHYINDTPKGVGRKLRINIWYRPQGSEVPPPPMSNEEMAQLGFWGYALDFLDCPEGMKWFFQREVNMHRTAIGPDSVDIGRAMELVARNPRDGGSSFITGRTVSSVSRSAYGARKVQNSTRDIRPARNWAQQPGVDEQAKRNLQIQINECGEQEKECLKHQNDFENKGKAIQKRHSELSAQKRSIGNRLEKRKKALQEYHKDQLKLENVMQQLQTEEAQKPPEAQRVKLKEDLLKIAKRRVRIAREYTNLVRAFIQEQENGTRAMLDVVQAEANLAALDRHVTQSSERFQKVLRETKEANEKHKEALNKVAQATTRAQNVLQGSDPELQNQWKDLEKTAAHETRSPDDIMQQIETENAKLELNIATNPAVVRQYEERQREIAELEEAVAQKEAKKNRLVKSIEKVKGQWYPALQQLVASINDKFSAAFERVHCAGEVNISQDEDYDKWAIDIMVKFRDSEKLTLLTGHRQSGGERSLTTILYLMSLTELARAPFSLVDEINQGMDQRAERLVHNQLVEVTCREESGQYFLITPKLLPDLAYHERMTVLCINNGEWLPDRRGIGSLQKMLDEYVAKNGGRARVSSN